MKDVERVLIGIAAPTCAGKTTLLRELEQRMGDELIAFSFDEYLYPNNSLELTRVRAEHPEFTNWENPLIYDYQRYLDDLDKLKSGLSVTIFSYSQKVQREGFSQRIVTPKTYTLIEGLYVFLTPDAVQAFDKRFFIDIPNTEVINRRLARRQLNSTAPWDSESYIRTEMIEGVEYYVNPQREYAHTILDGMKPAHVLAEEAIFEITRSS